MRFFSGIWLAIAISAFAWAGLHPSTAHAQSTVKDVFENYNLLGTFAQDCSKPASNDNYYYVNRLIDTGHVQRDRMNGPTARDYATVIDKASALGPNEVFISGKRVEGRFNDQPIEETWRVEANRQMAIEASVNGNKVITAGRFSNGQAVWWANRCVQR